MTNTVLKGFLAATVLATAAFATHPDYVCTSHDGESHLEVRHLINHRLPAEVILEKDDEQTLFGAALVPNLGPQTLFKKREYKLFTYPAVEAKLTVTSRPFMGRGGCGRGGCDDTPKKIIAAKLELSGTETLFSCYEEKH